MTDNVKESAAASKVNLLDFDLEGLTAWCAGIGEKAFRATQLSRCLLYTSDAADDESIV